MVNIKTICKKNPVTPDVQTVQALNFSFLHRISANSNTSPIRQLLNSPLLGRRNRKKQQAESSDEESYANNNDDSSSKYNYRDLETFQKAQLRQKVFVSANDFPFTVAHTLLVHRILFSRNRMFD